MSLPSINVTIEDRSLVLPTIPSGRSGYIVILGDRGPHNKVVEINDLSSFQRIFGRPNIGRTGQAHYLADKFLQRSKRLFVVRPALLTDATATNNSHIAHATISENTSTLLTTEVYTWTNGSNTISAANSTTLSVADSQAALTVAMIPYVTTALSLNITIGAVTASVTSTSGFATTGTLLIGTEQITYTGLTATTFTGLTRGANATVAAAHTSGDVVSPVETMTVTSTTGYPTTGTVLIGSEQVTYTAITATTFTGLTRGANGTTSAAHIITSQLLNTNLLTVTSTANFNTSGIITIGTEQIAYTGTTATTFTGLTRANAGTIGTPHALAAVVNEFSTAASILSVGQWVVPSSVTDLSLARQVISISADHLTLTLDAAYTGATVAVPTTVKYFQPLTVTTNASTDVAPLAGSTYTFTHGSATVTTTVATTANVGDWILSATDVNNLTLASQILAISVDNLTITLVKVYSGTSSTAAEVANTFNTAGGITTATTLDTTTTGILFHIHAVGTGSYYNDIVVRGVRNTAFEKRYIDSAGNPLYPNMFLDLFVYLQNQDGSLTLAEGPWTVSLINTIAGSVVRDINTGRELYLPTVVNNHSELINIIEGASIIDYLTATNAADLRQYTQTLLTAGVVSKTTLVGENGIGLGAGDDGVLFDSQQNLNIGNSLIQSIVAQGYAGTLPSTDGSIELIAQSVYPWYEFDYILAGGYTADIQSNAVALADGREDVMVLADTGSNIASAATDLALRQSTVTYNSFNVMLYSQYRQIFDVYTGRNVALSPVYHAIDRHLLIDQRDWIAEPVAGIDKGAINEPITLSYRANLTRLSEMIDVEINPTIVETQGKYILHQLTTWKQLSILKRGHAVKFVHFIKKEIPKLLKDILQHKATPFWIGQAQSRVDGFMRPFVVGFSSSERFTALTSFSATVAFDDLKSELNIALAIKPIRSIEIINVSIIVS